MLLALGTPKLVERWTAARGPPGLLQDHIGMGQETIGDAAVVTNPVGSRPRLPRPAGPSQPSFYGFFPFLAPPQPRPLPLTQRRLPSPASQSWPCAPGRLRSWAGSAPSSALSSSLLGVSLVRPGCRAVGWPHPRGRRYWGVGRQLVSLLLNFDPQLPREGACALDSTLCCISTTHKLALKGGSLLYPFYKVD